MVSKCFYVSYLPRQHSIWAAVGSQLGPSWAQLGILMGDDMPQNNYKYVENSLVQWSGKSKIRFSIEIYSIFETRLNNFEIPSLIYILDTKGPVPYTIIHINYAHLYLSDDLVINLEHLKCYDPTDQSYKRSQSLLEPPSHIPTT